MRIVFLPLAVALAGEPDPAAGALTRALPRELAARVAAVPDVTAELQPFLHVVEGKRRFGVYAERWPPKDLKRLLEDAGECDFLVHGDGDFGDPFRITLEVLSVPDLAPVAEETFSGPAFDGFALLERAVRFVCETVGIEAPAAAGEFPARKFASFLHLIRGRDAVVRLATLGAPEDPDGVFEPFFAAIDEEAGLDAARDEIAATASIAAKTGTLTLEVAERAIRRLLEIDPKAAVALAVLGRLREMAGDAVGAEEALRKAVDLEPGRAGLRYDLGSFLLSQGRASRAAKILETVKSDPQVGPAALLDLGCIRAEKDDPEAAIQYWREAVEIDPNLGLAWANLGKILVAQGRFDEAEEVFDRGFALPDVPWALRQSIGIYLAEQNRYKDGIRHLEEALRQNGNDAPSHLHLGRCYEAEGEKTKALHHLRKALSAGGAVADKAKKVLEEFANVEREEQLIATLRDAVSRPPEEQVPILKGVMKEEAKFPEAHIRLGIALIARGKPRAAERQFRRALKMVPEDPEAWSGLATSLKNRGKYADAEAAHRKAIERAPNEAGFHLNLADTLLRLGRRSEAAAEVARARVLSPTHPLLESFAAL
jgi:tetratricopeptide (TPR) repeat protein